MEVSFNVATPHFLELLGATGGSQMKIITIQLYGVEAAMLVEVQKGNKAYKDLQRLLLQ